MTDFIYQLLAGAGYTHPLHPAAVHVPVGMIIGGFIFSMAALLLKLPDLARTARHAFILALIALPPVAILGYMDWQHFYGGAALHPIRMKQALAAALFLLLFAAVAFDLKGYRNLILLHAFSLMTVIFIGFYGGELVYGRKAPAATGLTEQATAGAALFGDYCAMCHYPNSTETKIGPGLKGLFSRDTLPSSRRPVSEKTIRGQLKMPFADMPPQDELTEEEVSRIIDYLKTL